MLNTNNVDSLKYLRCSICYFEFETIKFFIQHLKERTNDTLHNEQFYKCFFCAAELLEYKKFILHLESEHLFQENNADCTPTCSTSTTFKNKKNLCEFCYKSFTKPSDLIRHIRIHKGEKPYKCEKCGREFRIKSTRDNHVKTHQKITENDIIQCKICEKKFLSKSALKLHLRIHTNENPFPCDSVNCNEKFRTKKNMKSHYRKYHLYMESESIDGENEENNLTNFKNSIMETAKQIATVENYNLRTSKCSSFTKVQKNSQTNSLGQINNPAYIPFSEKQEIVIRVQLRSGSVIGESSNMSLITTFNFHINSLINYFDVNMLVPLKRAGLPSNLTLSINRIAVLQKINELLQANPNLNLFTSIVSPTIQPLTHSTIPFTIFWVDEQFDLNNYRRHMPSFLIECYFAPERTGNYDPINRQFLAQSCLPMLYNTQNQDSNYNNSNVNFNIPSQEILFNNI